jgi:hypothetical protein
VIEAYAFLAMFTVQILAGSVLFPERVIRRVRRWATESGSERFLQMYPKRDFDKSIRLFVALFRAANIVAAMLGVLMLGWFFTQVRHPGSMGELKMPLVGYIFVQFAPLVLLALYSVVRGFKSLFLPPQEPKRSAILQRRGLFDFVSPLAVALAALAYVGFIAFAIFLDLEIYGNASLSGECWTAIAAVTAIYALNTLVIYKYLYGRRNPLQSHEGRVHSIAVNVKAAVYGSIAVACFFSLMGVVGQPQLTGWQPFALSLFLSTIWLLNLMGMGSPPGKSEAIELNERPVS